MDKRKSAVGDFDPLEALTVKRAAELLNVSEPTVRKLIRRGELRSLKIGLRSRRIRRADLSAFLHRRAILGDQGGDPDAERWQGPPPNRPPHIEEIPY